MVGPGEPSATSLLSKNRLYRLGGHVPLFRSETGSVERSPDLLSSFRYSDSKGNNSPCVEDRSAVTLSFVDQLSCSGRSGISRTGRCRAPSTDRVAWALGASSSCYRASPVWGSDWTPLDQVWALRLIAIRNHLKIPFLRNFKLSREIEMACFIGTSYVIRPLKWLYLLATIRPSNHNHWKLNLLREELHLYTWFCPWTPFKDPEVFDYLFFEDSAIGLATTLVEHREKAPILLFHDLKTKRFTG